jgi:hypothetical protein
MRQLEEGVLGWTLCTKAGSGTGRSTLKECVVGWTLCFHAGKGTERSA